MKSQYNEKNMPQSMEIEKTILSAMIIDEQALLIAIQMLKPQYFFNQGHSLIFKAMVNLMESNIRIDSVSLYESAKKMELLNEVGGASYLSKLNSFTSSGANIEYHCKILIEKWMRRKMITLCNEISNEALLQREDPFELLAKATNNFDDIRNVIEVAKEDENYWDRLPALVKCIEEERRQEFETTIKCDTFPSFNTATGGLQKGNLVAISGKYKAGKTRFAYALLTDYAVNKKIPVGMIGLEMGQGEYDKILLSMKTGTRYEYLRDPAGKNKDGSLKLKDEHLYEMKVKAEQIFPETTIMITDSVTYDVEIKAKIKYWVNKHKLKIVCIDYLQLVETTNKFERRDLVIAYLSRTFKNLARQLGIIIFIIVQENEKGESADSKAPLRDSDFWFSVTHPIDEGKQTVRIDGEEISVDQSHFLIKFKASRHSPNGGIFLTKFYENGEYKEYDYRYR